MSFVGAQADRRHPLLLNGFAIDVLDTTEKGTSASL
jgi:hypothetical protein